MKHVHVVFDDNRKLVHCQSFTITVYSSKHAIKKNSHFI